MLSNVVCARLFLHDSDCYYLLLPFLNGSCDYDYENENDD